MKVIILSSEKIPFRNIKGAVSTTDFENLVRAGLKPIYPLINVSWLVLDESGNGVSENLGGFVLLDGSPGTLTEKVWGIVKDRVHEKVGEVIFLALQENPASPTYNPNHRETLLGAAVYGPPGWWYNSWAIDFEDVLLEAYGDMDWL